VWHRAASTHFTVYGEISPGAVRDLAIRLERLRGVLEHLSPAAKLDAAEPIRVFAFADAAGIAPFLPEGRAAGSVAGFLLPHELGAHAAFVFAAVDDPLGLVVEQYVHYLLHSQLPWLPDWFRTGVAELYGTFETDERESRIGLPSRANLGTLRMLADNRLSAEAIVGRRPRGLGADPAYESSCWALAHYLLIGEGDRQDRARDFVRRLARGEVPGEALGASFGQLVEDLDVKLRAYVESASFTYYGMKLGPDAGIALDSAALLPHEVDAALGELLGRVAPSRRDQARALFEQALAAYPDYAPAIAGRANLLELSGDLAAAISAYERAALADREDFLVHYRYGNALLSTLGNSRPSDEAGRLKLERARAALSRSVELNPGFAPAWARLGFAWGLESTPNPEEVEALERAAALQPGQLDVAFNLVLAYARQGDRAGVDTGIENVHKLGADEARLARAREIRYQLEYRIANRLMKEQNLDDAVALLSRITSDSTDPALRERAAAQLDLVVKVAQHNRFVVAYNAVVAALTQGDAAAGFRALERLREVAKPGIQREIAGDLQLRLIEIEAGVASVTSE